MATHAYSVRPEGEFWAVVLNGTIIGSGMDFERAELAAAVAGRMSQSRGHSPVHEGLCYDETSAVEVKTLSTGPLII